MTILPSGQRVFNLLRKGPIFKVDTASKNNEGGDHAKIRKREK
jgi:hypothetical protein